MHHHPWRRLRERLPEWTVVLTRLPPGMLGATDLATRTIYLEERQLQAQRRCTLDHELDHVEAGDIGRQTTGREVRISRDSAVRLIPLDHLVDAARWAHSVEELADECWVEVATMLCRIENLTGRERIAVRRAVAERDFHEEGLGEDPPTHDEESR